VAYVTDRPVGNSPLEGVLFGLFLVALIGVGLVWAAGVLVGAILGAALPGDVRAGVASLVESFPEVGRAWQPPIPSVAVWISAAGIGGVFGPLAWKLWRAGRLKDGGARWATVTDLRRAGLLIRDQSQPHGIQEKPKLANAPE
jgi:hypothetical protein